MVSILRCTAHGAFFQNTSPIQMPDNFRSWYSQCCRIDYEYLAHWRWDCWWRTHSDDRRSFCKKNNIYTGWPISIWTILKSGCGIQMSQVTPIKFSMLFKHIYGKRFWKFGDHCFNISLFHGPSWSRVLDSIHRYGVILTFLEKKFKGHCEAIVDVKIIHFIDL